MVSPRSAGRPRLWRRVARLDRRAGVAAVAVGGWALVAIVGLGADPAVDRWLGLPSLELVIVVLMLLGALVGLPLLVLARVGGPPGGEAKRPRRSWWLVAIALGAMMLLGLVRPPAQPLEEGLASGASQEVAEEDGGPRSIEAVGPRELAVPVILLATTLVVMAWARRRLTVVEATAPDRDRPLDDALEAALSAAHHELALGGDPRSAVLAAYAKVEATLEERGEGRAQSETPAEHVRRVLTANDWIDTESLVRLARLYELARYSRRPITTDDQARARADLDRLRRQLAGRRTS